MADQIAKEGRPNRNSDVRRGRSHRSLSVRRELDAMGRRIHGTVVWVPFHRKDRVGYELVLSSHDRKGGSYKRMNGVEKE